MDIYTQFQIGRSFKMKAREYVENLLNESAPSWIRHLSLNDLKNYEKDHPGAKKETLNYIQRELYNRQSKATPLNPVFTNKDKAEVTVKYRWKDRNNPSYIKDHWVKEIFEKAMSYNNKKDFIMKYGKDAFNNMQEISSSDVGKKIYKDGLIIATDNNNNFIASVDAEGNFKTSSYFNAKNRDKNYTARSHIADIGDKFYFIKNNTDISDEQKIEANKLKKGYDELDKIPFNPNSYYQNTPSKHRANALFNFKVNKNEQKIEKVKKQAETIASNIKDKISSFLDSDERYFDKKNMDEEIDKINELKQLLRYHKAAKEGKLYDLDKKRYNELLDKYAND